MICESIARNTGLAVDEGQLIWWERKGLLGNVARTDSKRRDYNSTNASYCIMIVVSKLLRWDMKDLEALIKDKDKTVKDKFIRDCKILIDKLPEKLYDVLQDIDKLV